MYGLRVEELGMVQFDVSFIMFYSQVVETNQGPVGWVELSQQVEPRVEDCRVSTDREESPDHRSQGLLTRITL